MFYLKSANLFKDTNYFHISMTYVFDFYAHVFLLCLFFRVMCFISDFYFLQLEKNGENIFSDNSMKIGFTSCILA